MTQLAEPTTPPPRVVRTVVDIAAPPARVFEALTDPRRLAAWWGGDGARVLDCDADVRPGGAWRVRTAEPPNGAEREAAGEYRVVDPPRRLEQSWRATGDEGPSVVRYDLEPLDVGGADGTRLTVTHTGPSAPSACATRMRLTRALAGLGHRVRPIWCGAPTRRAIHTAIA
ncbi:MAG TPA: SRPBCC domain-containing protein [Gemmatimonadaceae bacterium]|nr:SRPBCC domain-containing protein [Gemmatimonadaceae bacterium]